MTLMKFLIRLRWGQPLSFAELCCHSDSFWFVNASSGSVGLYLNQNKYLLFIINSDNFGLRLS